MVFPGSDRPHSNSRTNSRSSRSDSDASDGSREGFLDNVPLRASFSFKAQQVREARLLAEDEKFDKYKLKLKAISLFYIILSVFVLINSSIGASSAPFYDKYTECSKFDLTDEC